MPAEDNVTMSGVRRPPDGVGHDAFVTTSWDDGHVYDFAVANLLDDYDLPGTFYVAPRNRELPPRARLRDRDIVELASRFEIGGHTLTHLRLTLLNDAEAMA